MCVKPHTESEAQVILSHAVFSGDTSEGRETRVVLTLTESF